MTKNNFIAKIYAFSAVFCWATSFVSSKLAFKQTTLSPIDLGVLRYFFASLFLIPLIFILKMKKPTKSYIFKFTLSGFFGYSAYVILFNIAISLISPATSSVINSLAPGLTAIMAYFIFKEKINLMGIIALMISFSGILVLSLYKSELSINSGIIYMLFAALCLSSYNITQRIYVNDYRPVEVMTYSVLFGSVLLILYRPSSLKLLLNMDIISFIHIIYLAIVPSILGYYFWSKAMYLASHTSVVTNFMFVTPFIATLLAFFVFRTTPQLNTYLGAGLILLGMIVFQRQKNIKNNS